MSYHHSNVLDAFSAVWRRLQERTEALDLRRRTAAERDQAQQRSLTEGYGLADLYDEARYELDSALGTAEIYNPTVSVIGQGRRKEERAAISERVQTALDNENTTWGGISTFERKLAITRRAEAATQRAEIARRAKIARDQQQRTQPSSGRPALTCSTQGRRGEVAERER